MFLRYTAAALLTLTLNLSAVEIIGHRGASHDAPENTLPSFKLGWEQKADADELDIWLTKDGKILVCHDGNTKRTAGFDKKIVEQTLDEVRALDAGVWKGPEWKGTKLPKLDEVLVTIPDGKRLFIEIKCGPEVLPELERVLKASGKTDAQFVIIGFDYATVKLAKQRFPKIATYWLSSFKQNVVTRQWTPTADELAQKAKAAGLDGVDLSNKGPVDRAFVDVLKAAGLQCYMWTVDDPEQAKRFIEAGVNGITTNRPGWLREQLR